MRRFLLCSLAAGFVLAMSGVSARACINDREVNNSEREFKSQYQDKPATESTLPVQPPASATDSLKEYGPLVLGGSLLAGAVVQVRRKSTTRQV